MFKQSVIVTGAYPCAALGDQDSALWVRRYILYRTGGSAGGTIVESVRALRKIDATLQQ
jgi:hypothetical protein